MGQNPVRGMKVIIARIDDDLHGVRVAQEYKDHRKLGTYAELLGYVGGYGGDIWFAKNADGTQAVYCVTEMEVVEEPGEEKEYEVLLGCKALKSGSDVFRARSRAEAIEKALKSRDDIELEDEDQAIPDKEWFVQEAKEIK